MRNVFWRQIRLLLVVFIGYLFHVTVMTQLDTTVSINLPLVILSVVIVGYPRYKAFWVGAVYDKNGDVIDTFGNRIACGIIRRMEVGKSL